MATRTQLVRDFDSQTIRLADGTHLFPAKVIRFDRVDAPDKNLLAAVKFRGLVS